jgi:hypothetical protein
MRELSYLRELNPALIAGLKFLLNKPLGKLLFQILSEPSLFRSLVLGQIQACDLRSVNHAFI